MGAHLTMHQENGRNLRNTLITILAKQCILIHHSEGTIQVRAIIGRTELHFQIFLFFSDEADEHVSERLKCTNIKPYLERATWIAFPQLPVLHVQKNEY